MSVGWGQINNLGKLLTFDPFTGFDSEVSSSEVAAAVSLITRRRFLLTIPAASSRIICLQSDG